MDPEERLLEIKRLKAMLKYEKKAKLQGFQKIAGVDEAGRGPLAGPVVAAACILPPRVKFIHLNDSKQLTAEQRLKLFKALTRSKNICYGIGIIDHLMIDMINILQASIQAMLQAIRQLQITPDLLLVDGMHLNDVIDIPSWKIIEGDALSQSVAAASILAKVTRDRLMQQYHDEWPHYNFKQNKGYGTPEHLEALEKFGPCPIHRKTFAPVAKKEEQLQFAFN